MRFQGYSAGTLSEDASAGAHVVQRQTGQSNPLALVSVQSAGQAWADISQ